MYVGRLQVTLFVRDVEASVEYYQRVLGFAFRGYWDPETHRVVEGWNRPEPPPFAEMLAGENRIGLRPAAHEPESSTVECALVAADLDVLYRRVRDNDADATQPTLQPWGARTFTVTDPDGHTWVIARSD